MSAVILQTYGFNHLRITSIINFLGNVSCSNTIDYRHGVKQLGRGENALISNHLKEFSSLDGKYFRATIFASMKNKEYNVEVKCLC